MPKAFDEWRVLPHEPLLKLADNLLWARGSIPGMSLKRTMLLVRLNDGQLLIHNGIALEEAQMAEIERFGKPAYLVVPNGGHRLDAPAYKKRYPALRVFTPAGSRKRVEQVVHVDGSYDEFPGNDVVRCETLHGVGQTEGRAHRAISRWRERGAQRLPVQHGSQTRSIGLPLYDSARLSAGPRVSRLAKLVFIKDKPALRADFERFAALPELMRLIVAHEKVASGPDARAALLEAASYL